MYWLFQRNVAGFFLSPFAIFFSLQEAAGHSLIDPFATPLPLFNFALECVEHFFFIFSHRRSSPSFSKKK